MFVRGGVVRPGRSLGDAGDRGLYWSFVGYDIWNAYGLYFTSGLVYPSDYSTRYVGYFVRCVALGG